MGKNVLRFYSEKVRKVFMNVAIHINELNFQLKAIWEKQH